MPPYTNDTHLCVIRLSLYLRFNRINKSDRPVARQRERERRDLSIAGERVTSVLHELLDEVWMIPDELFARIERLIVAGNVVIIVVQNWYPSPNLYEGAGTRSLALRCRTSSPHLTHMTNGSVLGNTLRICTARDIRLLRRLAVLRRHLKYLARFVDLLKRVLKLHEKLIHSLSNQIAP